MMLSGLIYRGLIDPLLSGLRKGIRNQIPAGSSCMDIACGTGALVFMMKDHCSRVTGVDMDQLKIRAAANRVERKGLDHLHFAVKDAANLSDTPDAEYDFCTLSMAIHQFQPDIRESIIREALRVGKTLIIADYASPLPFNPAGWLSYCIEMLAGREHFSNFRHYQRNGGLTGLLQELHINSESPENRGFNVFRIVKVQS